MALSTSSGPIGEAFSVGAPYLGCGGAGNSTTASRYPSPCRKVIAMPTKAWASLDQAGGRCSRQTYGSPPTWISNPAFFVFARSGS